MLKRITLKNFRQHVDRTFDFGAGNVVVRGPNENGKTTVIEALMYVMGGARQCRNSDFIRWGEKPSKCQVEILVEFQGVQVRATRGPRGAEIYVPADAKAPIVTGQTEVTEWFASQLGVSMDRASKMMFAGQKEIGGLLDESGNSKVVEFIEEMSGLDIIDRLIASLQADGLHGPTADMVARAEETQAMLDSRTSFDHGALIAEKQRAMEPLQSKAAALQGSVDEYREDIARVDGVIAEWQAYNMKEVRKQTAVESATAAVSAADSKLAALIGQTVPDVVHHEDKIARLRELQIEQRSLEEKIAARASLDRHKAPENEWEGTKEQLDDFIAEERDAETRLSAAAGALREQISNLKNRAKQLRADKPVIGQKCRSCGQMIPDAENAESHALELENQAVAAEAEIEPLEAKLKDTEGLIKEARENVAAGQEIAREKVFAGLSRYPDWFATEGEFYPPRVKWVGGDTDAQIEDFDEKIRVLESEVRIVQIHHTRVEEARNALKQAQTTLSQAHAVEIGKPPERSMDKLRSDRADFSAAQEHAREQRAIALSEIAQLEYAVQALQDEQERYAAETQAAVARLSQLRDRIQLFEFNNQLIDALRRAKPAVANELWSMVLKAVSTYLTTMRGEPSIVTREGKTFMINGNPYSSFSGSALDLLALGIRIALTKVFVPGADLMILDEPFAACSAERTLQGLALTASAGFSQMLIITHESETEELFDSIVEV